MKTAAIVEITAITELEKQVLVNIARNEYSNFGSFEELEECGSSTWAFVATRETKELAGALGSLVKKGFCGVSNERRAADNTAWMTKEGIAALKQTGWNF